MGERFRIIATKVSQVTGSPLAFLVALSLIFVWILTGPVFGFSDTWQLVINTTTTIVTFLMVFLIQNTQNRDTRAIQLKLDELLRGTKGARTGMVDIENLPDSELEELQEQFDELHKKYSSELEKRKNKKS